MHARLGIHPSSVIAHCPLYLQSDPLIMHACTQARRVALNLAGSPPTPGVCDHACDNVSTRPRQRQHQTLYAPCTIHTLYAPCIHAPDQPCMPHTPDPVCPMHRTLYAPCTRPCMPHAPDSRGARDSVGGSTVGEVHVTAWVAVL